MGFFNLVLKILWILLLICVTIACVCFMIESVIKISNPKNNSQRTAYIVSLTLSSLCSIFFIWFFYKTYKSLWSNEELVEVIV